MSYTAPVYLPWDENFWLLEKMKHLLFYVFNKKLYRAFGRQNNQLIMNTPVLQGLLRANKKVNKLKSNEVQILKYETKESKRVVS